MGDAGKPGPEPRTPCLCSSQRQAVRVRRRESHEPGGGLQSRVKQLGTRGGCALCLGPVGGSCALSAHTLSCEPNFSSSTLTTLVFSSLTLTCILVSFLLI